MDQVFTLGQSVLAHLGDIVMGLGMVIGGASILARLTPTLADDHALAWLQKLVDKLALVGGSIKRADPTK